MRNYKYILSIALLICALAYTLWFVFSGFGNHQDPLYWLYKYEHLEGGWLAAGTILTGGTIVKLFGAQLLPLRLAGWLCVVGAIALPYCCLLTKEQWRENLHWLALAYIIMGYGAFQEFSPGTLSVLLLSALWVTQSPIIAGLAIAVRFPNILALLVLIPLWKKRSLWNIPIAALTAGIIYLLGYFFMTPAAADGAMSSHDFWPMISKLWTNGGKLIGYIILAIGVLAIGKFEIKNPKLQNTKYLLPIRTILAGAALFYFVWYAIKPMQWYNIGLSYLLSALCLVIAFATREKILYVGAAILAVATLGTDTAWLKLFPIVLCLLPVAATYHEPSMKRYLWGVLAILSIVVVMRMTTNSVGQTNLLKATTFASSSPYRHIAIREAEQERLTQYIADVDSLQCQMSNVQCPILAVGQEMHLMRAVTGCEAAKFNEFWSNIFDSVYTAKYREIIRQERPIVFCSYSPQFKTKPIYKDRESALENMLREEGYREIERSKYKYMIYIPDYDQEIQ